jgi:hypothetical protein
MSELVYACWGREALLLVLVWRLLLAMAVEKIVQGLEVSMVSEKGKGLLGVNRIVTKFQSYI